MGVVSRNGELHLLSFIHWQLSSLSAPPSPYILISQPPALAFFSLVRLFSFSFLFVWCLAFRWLSLLSACNFDFRLYLAVFSDLHLWSLTVWCFLGRLLSLCDRLRTRLWWTRNDILWRSFAPWLHCSISNHSCSWFDDDAFYVWRLCFGSTHAHLYIYSYTLTWCHRNGESCLLAACPIWLPTLRCPLFRQKASLDFHWCLEIKTSSPLMRSGNSFPNIRFSACERFSLIDPLSLGSVFLANGGLSLVSWSIPGEHFPWERWSSIGIFISLIDFARALIWQFHWMSVPGEHFSCKRPQCALLCELFCSWWTTAVGSVEVLTVSRFVARFPVSRFAVFGLSLRSSTFGLLLREARVLLGAKEWGAQYLSSRLDLRPLASRLGLRSFASRLGLRPLVCLWQIFGRVSLPPSYLESIGWMWSTIVNLAFEVFGRSCEKSGFLYALVSNGDTKCASCVRWGVKELYLLCNTLL